MQVVAGLLYDNQRRIFITQRANQGMHANLWEFPGGKVETGESLSAALTREIHEELGIQIETYALYDNFEYTYATTTIQFYFFQIFSYTGLPQLQANQQASYWVDPAQLSAFTFPAANQRIIDRLHLKCYSEH